MRANGGIRYFRHALSPDERRVRYKPSIWERPNAKDMDIYGVTSVGESNVEEAWFAGYHCGTTLEMGKAQYSQQPSPHTSSGWMIREILKAGVGILSLQKGYVQRHRHGSRNALSTCA